jgi:CheY-like chemotaxis protein/HPt (histidine-containing phosphotransfer) domain-containing protein
MKTSSIPSFVDAFPIDLVKLVDLMPGYVYWKDRDSIIMGCNELQANSLGLASKDELVGRTSLDLIWQGLPTRERHRRAELNEEIDKSIMYSGCASTAEEIMITQEGHITCLTHKVPLKNAQDQVIGLISISTNISSLLTFEKKSPKRKYLSLEHLIQQEIPLEDPYNPSLKILLVEDNYIALKTAQTLLESLQHQIDVAENSLTAIKHFKPNKYDLIFIDVGLPDLDGYKLTEQLRAMEMAAGADPVPIIALTAHDSTNIHRKASASGITDIFSKPVTIKAIYTAINRYIYQQKPPMQSSEADNKELLAMSEVNRFIRKTIDLENGAKILGKDEKSAHKMLEELINLLPQDRLEIEETYRSNDLAKLAKVIHKFYGGLCYVGAPHLRQATKELESALLKQEKHQINRLYQRVLDEMSALEKEFKLLSLTPP